MGGIFIGFLCAALLVVVLGRLRASQPPRSWLGMACWALVALTGLDGLNAFFFDGHLAHLYAPTTTLRLLTGLGAGLAVGLMAIPVVAGVVWSHPLEESSVEQGGELVGGLALAGLAGGLVLSGVGVLLWPLGLAMLVGVLAAFGTGNLYVIVWATRRVGQAITVSDLRGGLLSSFGLSLLEVGGLSALRSWLVAAFGFTWGV